MIPHLDGQVWLSITGYGRAVADRVAFGDDAAVVGGILTDLAGWRWVLFVNAPIGITPPAGAAWAVPESRIASAPRRLDVPGALSVTAGLILVVYVVVSTHTHPWAQPRRSPSWLPAPPCSRRSPCRGPAGRYQSHSVRRSSACSSCRCTCSRSTTTRAASRAGIPAPRVSILSAALLAAKLVARLGVRRQLVTGLILAAAAPVWMAKLTPGDGCWSSVFAANCSQAPDLACRSCPPPWPPQQPPTLPSLVIRGVTCRRPTARPLVGGRRKW